MTHPMHLVSLASMSLTTNVANAPIEFAPVDSTRAVTLTLAEGIYNGPTVQQRTRMFNGQILGPTILVRPGDAFTVTLVNALPPPGFSTAALHNEFRTPDITNLHTHGLHVSSAAPGDDVFTEVSAGSTYTYSYDLPAFHMGGTFWYHPHHHGSTAIQAGGGAAGMLIVEDAPGSLPPSVAALEEMRLFLQHLDMPELTEIAEEQ